MKDKVLRAIAKDLNLEKNDKTKQVLNNALDALEYHIRNEAEEQIKEQVLNLVKARLKTTTEIYEDVKTEWSKEQKSEGDAFTLFKRVTFFEGASVALQKLVERLEYELR